jgi:hypothetical protein
MRKDPGESVTTDDSRKPAASTSGKFEDGAVLKWCVIAWMAVIAIFHLLCAARGQSIYRDIHLGTALEYAKGPIDLFKPIIVGFNLNHVPTPQEFPLWQASAGLVMKLFGLWFGWANATSLVYFFSCLYPLYQIAKQASGRRAAWWTLILYLGQPLSFVYAGEASPDGQAIAAAIWFLYFASRLLTEQNLKWLLLTAVMGSLAAVSKLPFFVAAGLGCFFLTIDGYSRQVHVWIWLGVAAILSGGVFLLWNGYVGRCYARAEMPFVDLRFSNPEMKYWYFGDLKYRLSPGIWAKGIWRSLNGIFGSFALAPVILFGLFCRPVNKMARSWLLGAAVSTAIFFHIVLHHGHYYMMFAPAIAMIGAEVVVRVESQLSRAGLNSSLVVAGVVTVLWLGTIQGVTGIHTILHLDRYPYVVSNLIKLNTAQTDKILIQGGGWGGELLFLSDRQGLSIWDTKILEDRQFYERLKKLGYSKLVMVSQPPLLAAVQHSTSISATVDRVSYEKFTTPIVEQLPTVLKTEDILIKDLP